MPCSPGTTSLLIEITRTLLTEKERPLKLLEKFPEISFQDVLFEQSDQDPITESYVKMLEKYV